MKKVLVWWILSIVFMACGGEEEYTETDNDSPPMLAGTEGGPCYPNGTCNDGLQCLSDLCVEIPDETTDTQVDEDVQPDIQVEDTEEEIVDVDFVDEDFQHYEFEKPDNDSTTITCNSDTCKDTSTNLTWMNNSVVMPHYSDAVTFCNDSILAGITDWRVPTITELRTLIVGCTETMTNGTCSVFEGGCTSSSCDDSGGCVSCVVNSGPSPNGCYWNAVFGTTCKVLWSSTLMSDSPPASPSHWVVNYAGGVIFSLADEFAPENYTVNYVRCVKEN